MSPWPYAMDRVGDQEHFADTGDEDRAAGDYLALLSRGRC